MHHTGDIVVVLYVWDVLALRIIRIAGEAQSINNIRWIGVDAWTGRHIPDDKNIQQTAKDALGVMLMTQPIPGFTEYIKT